MRALRLDDDGEWAEAADMAHAPGTYCLKDPDGGPDLQCFCTARVPYAADALFVAVFGTAGEAQPTHRARLPFPLDIALYPAGDLYLVAYFADESPGARPVYVTSPPSDEVAPKAWADVSLDAWRLGQAEWKRAYWNAVTDTLAKSFDGMWTHLRAAENTHVCSTPAAALPVEAEEDDEEEEDEEDVVESAVLQGLVNADAGEPEVDELEDVADLDPRTGLLQTELLYAEGDSDDADSIEHDYEEDDDRDPPDDDDDEEIVTDI